MSDVRSVLTEALREHRANLYQSGDEWAVDCDGCAWHDYGYFGVDAENEAHWAHDEHVADVQAKALDAAPGVVVTQLPKPDEETAATEFENGSKWFAGGDVVVYDDGEIHLFGAVWPLSDVQNLAAGLAAAAVLSKGER